jgi:hypothetical protein
MGHQKPETSHSKLLTATGSKSITPSSKPETLPRSCRMRVAHVTEEKTVILWMSFEAGLALTRGEPVFADADAQLHSRRTAN